MSKDKTKKRSGTSFVCDLPSWADKRTRTLSYKGEIYLVHPDHPPHKYDEKKKKWIAITDPSFKIPKEHIEGVCQVCGCTETTPCHEKMSGAACSWANKERTLSVHHKYYRTDLEPWEYPGSALITLCQDCHEVIKQIDFKNLILQTCKVL